MKIQNNQVMNRRPVENVEGDGGTSVAEVAEVVGRDPTNIHADFPRGFRREKLLLLRHGIVHFQLHR